MARLRTASATSAGGVVVRTEEVGRSSSSGSVRRERDGRTWTLPKGTPDPGETIEQTAFREVREETGLEVRIIRPIGPIEYWFFQSGTRIHKVVHYFLMEPTGGDLSRHDAEFETVRWVDVADAPTMLTFETEQALVARATAGHGQPDAEPSAPAPASGALG